MPGPGSSVPSKVEISVATPHAVGNDLVKHIVASEGFIDMHGIDVAGHAAKSSMSCIVSVRDRLTVSPILISSKVRFSIDRAGDARRRQPTT